MSREHASRRNVFFNVNSSSPTSTFFQQRLYRFLSNGPASEKSSCHLWTLFCQFVSYCILKIFCWTCALPDSDQLSYRVNPSIAWLRGSIQKWMTVQNVPPTSLSGCRCTLASTALDVLMSVRYCPAERSCIKSG